MPNHITTKKTQISLIFRKGPKKILPLNIVHLHFIAGSFIGLPPRATNYYFYSFYRALGYFDYSCSVSVKCAFAIT